MNIYVGNLSVDITERDLKNAFREFGKVALVRIIKDRSTGDLTRFGFVEMPDKTEARDAIQRIKQIKGKRILVKKEDPNADYASAEARSLYL